MVVNKKKRQKFFSKFRQIAIAALSKLGPTPSFLKVETLLKETKDRLWFLIGLQLVEFVK